MDYNFKLTEFKHASAETNTPAEPRENTGRPPDMKGQYTIEDRPPTEIAGAWIETSQAGAPYIKGNLVSPGGFVGRVAAKRTAADPSIPVPPNIKIDKGNLRLFSNDAATDDNNQPHWRGYAHQWDGTYAELSAYNRPNGVEGYAKPYRPFAPASEAPAAQPPGTS